MMDRIRLHGYILIFIIVRVVCSESESTLSIII